MAGERRGGPRHHSGAPRAAGGRGGQEAATEAARPHQPLQVGGGWEGELATRFGLRVVGVEASSPWARVLWLLPGGAAEEGGLRLGDKVRLGGLLDSAFGGGEGE